MVTNIVITLGFTSKCTGLSPERSSAVLISATERIVWWSTCSITSPRWVPHPRRTGGIDFHYHQTLSLSTDPQLLRDRPESAAAQQVPVWRFDRRAIRMNYSGPGSRDVLQS